MNDGWNESNFQYFLDTCDKLNEAVYEIRNCVKGAYTYCHTYDEMVEYLRNLSERLVGAVDEIDTVEYDEE